MERSSEGAGAVRAAKGDCGPRPAIGHMPFAGHRTVAEWDQLVGDNVENSVPFVFSLGVARTCSIESSMDETSHRKTFGRKRALELKLLDRLRSELRQ